MNRHHVFKFLSIVFYYGWFGVMYGILFSLLLQEIGYDASWLKSLVILVTLTLTLWCAYFSEMRYHMPTHKYIAIVFMALFGFFGCVKYPLFSPLFFGLFLGTIAYKCRDCVAFTQVSR